MDRKPLNINSKKNLNNRRNLKNIVFIVLVIMFGVALFASSKQNTSNIKNLNIESITKYVLNITKYNQKFPDYSAIKVDGKPLWWWSNNNKLNEIENKRPTKEINIFNINLEKIELITLDNLAYNSINKINKINSKENFRQNEIINLWKDYLTNNNYIYIINMTARVSSGTYIRQLCIDIGNYFNIPSMADNINRLNIHLD